jgi:hypothetical protein
MVSPFSIAISCKRLDVHPLAGSSRQSHYVLQTTSWCGDNLERMSTMLWTLKLI